MPHTATSLPDELLADHAFPCVSIYMPTVQAGPETRQNPIRLKALLKEASAQVGEAAADADPEQLLADMARLVEDHDFWQHQLKGLALFASPDANLRYRLPFEVDEHVAVGEAFHLKRLLPLFPPETTFAILAISQNEVRLLEADRWQVRRAEVPGMPGSLAEAMQYDDPERSLQSHSAGRERTGKREVMHHGQDVSGEEERPRLLRFCQQVDRAVREHLAGSETPLVLAAVDSVQPVYREASKYPYLYGKGIEGSPERKRDEALHAEAVKAVSTLLDEPRRKAEKAFHALAPDGQASDDIGKVVPAAAQARVEQLLVCWKRDVPGRFDPELQRVLPGAGSSPKGTDLADLAARMTLKTGGTVIPVEEDEIPSEDSAVAAVFRY